jgi:hypothetical protein
MPRAKTSQRRSRAGKKIAAGIGLAAAAAGAAGAYFLYGTKEGTKTRKKLHNWALNAKEEVLELLESANTLTQKTYGEVVEKVAKRYKKAIDSRELNAFVKEMKGHWKHIKKHVGKCGDNAAKKNIKRKAPARRRTSRRR